MGVRNMLNIIFVFFFFKQKTAYEMRISDWSSDVCSSDLIMETKMIGNKIAEARKKAAISQAQLAQRLFISPQAVGKWERGESMPDIIKIGRASCRERVCQYV